MVNMLAVGFVFFVQSAHDDDDDLAPKSLTHTPSGNCINFLAASQTRAGFNNPSIVWPQDRKRRPPQDK